MPVLTIIRGLPGSGKSTLAERLVDEDHMNDSSESYPVEWFEADMFFEHTYGKGYKFDGSHIRDAHDWCYFNVLKSLRDDINTIVSNTFTQAWEMSRYLNLRDIIPDLQIKIIEVKTQFKSVHGIPDEAFERMQKRWEDVPEDLDIPVEVILPAVLDAYNDERLVSKYDKESI